MQVEIVGDRLRACFTEYGPEQYQQFLKLKALPEHQIEVDEVLNYTLTAPSRFASMLGLDVPDRGAQVLPVPEWFYDDQEFIVETAIEAKRFACWSDCGLGKTFIEAEFARQVMHLTGGRVLGFSMNEIVPQWVEMVEEFYGGELPVHTLESREEMKEWANGDRPDLPDCCITNYEKMNPDESGQIVSELRNLAGVFLDESSRLKTGGGKQKWALIKSCKGIEYKLSATATPAPNDWMEFASQGSFLERMRTEGDLEGAGEVIWTFFAKDKSGKWTVKPHAREGFFEFLSSWSIYVSDPRRFGCGLTGKVHRNRPISPTNLNPPRNNSRLPGNMSPVIADNYYWLVRA